MFPAPRPGIGLRPVTRTGGLRVLGAGLGLACVLCGCGSAGDALSQRSVSVVFEENRTQADVARVRAACDGVGGAKALPAGPDNPTNRRYPLRFDVSGLEQRSRGKLLACLDADPSVKGFQDSESTRG